MSMFSTSPYYLVNLKSSVFSENSNAENHEVDKSLLIFIKVAK